MHQNSLVSRIQTQQGQKMIAVEYWVVVTIVAVATVVVFVVTFVVA